MRKEAIERWLEVSRSTSGLQKMVWLQEFRWPFLTVHQLLISRHILWYISTIIFYFIRSNGCRLLTTIAFQLVFSVCYHKLCWYIIRFVLKAWTKWISPTIIILYSLLHYSIIAVYYTMCSKTVLEIVKVNSKHCSSTIYFLYRSTMLGASPNRD